MPARGRNAISGQALGMGARPCNPPLLAPGGTRASAAPHWGTGSVRRVYKFHGRRHQALATRAILHEIGGWPLSCPLCSDRKLCQEAEDADQDGSSRVHQQAPTSPSSVESARGCGGDHAVRDRVLQGRLLYVLLLEP